MKIKGHFYIELLLNISFSNDTIFMSFVMCLWFTSIESLDSHQANIVRGETDNLGLIKIRLD